MWSEKKVTDEFETGLKRNYKPVFFWKFWQGPYSRKGLPDHILGVEGRALLLEAKKYGEDLSPLQKRVLLRWTATGNLGAKLSIDEAHENFVLVAHASPSEAYDFELSVNFNKAESDKLFEELSRCLKK